MRCMSKGLILTKHLNTFYRNPMSERHWECSIVCIYWNEDNRSSASRIHPAPLCTIDEIARKTSVIKLLRPEAFHCPPTIWTLPLSPSKTACMRLSCNKLDWGYFPSRLCSCSLCLDPTAQVHCFQPQGHIFRRAPPPSQKIRSSFQEQAPEETHTPCPLDAKKCNFHGCWGIFNWRAQREGDRWFN